MKTASVTTFRQNMKEYLKQVDDDQDILILSRPKKKGFVVMSLEYFESLEETAHLLSTPANASRLMKSIEEAEQGNVIVKNLDL
jgi:antitoxin YefM